MSGKSVIICCILSGALLVLSPGLFALGLLEFSLQAFAAIAISSPVIFLLMAIVDLIVLLRALRPPRQEYSVIKLAILSTMTVVLAVLALIGMGVLIAQYFLMQGDNLY